MYFKITYINYKYYLSFKNIMLCELTNDFLLVFKKLKSKKVYITKNVRGIYKLFFVNVPTKIIVVNKDTYYYDYEQSYILNIDYNDLINLKIVFDNKSLISEKEIQSLFKFKNSTIREFNIYLYN